MWGEIARGNGSVLMGQPPLKGSAAGDFAVSFFLCFSFCRTFFMIINSVVERDRVGPVYSGAEDDRYGSSESSEDVPVDSLNSRTQPQKNRNRQVV